MKRNSKTKYRSEFSGDYYFDYKDPLTLYRFVMECGKIVPSRISKLSLNQQKKAASAIKKARNLGLLPEGTNAYDNFKKPDPISPLPFSLD